jgi:hypothetical protein
MAVTQTASRHIEQLAESRARLAASVSLVLSAGGIAAVVAYLATAGPLATGATVQAVAELAFLAVAGLCAAHLLAGRVWAQRALLGLWLAAGVLIVVAIVGDALGGRAAAWSRPIGERSAGYFAADRPVATWALAPATGVLALLLVPVAGAIWTLLTAARRGSRLRYASAAALSAGLAVAAVVAVNLIAHTDYHRASAEAFGRYALSERAKRILRQIDAPLRLTCVYASSDPKHRSDELRPRVRELLEEMREVKPDTQVVTVRNEAQRLEVFDAIRRRAADRAKAHHELLERFGDRSQLVEEQATGQRDRWDALARQGGYLNLWSLPAQFARVMGSVATKWRSLREEARQQMQGLPDYAELTERIRKLADDTDKDLQAQATALGDLARLPEAIAAGREVAIEKADQAVQAVEALRNLLAASDANAPPDDAAKCLRQFVEAVRDTQEALLSAEEALGLVAGEELSSYVTASRVWQVRREEPIVIFGPGYSPPTLATAFGRAAEDLAGAAGAAQTSLQAGNEAYQAQTARKLHQQLGDLLEQLRGTRRAAAQALDRLQDLDEPTRKLLAEPMPPPQLAEPVRAVLDEARALPDLPDGTLAEDVRQPNTVIIELGDRPPEVVGFDEVWPTKAALPGPPGDADRRRTFNGDSAVSSKLLAMTHEPFATVYVTYLPPPRTPWLPPGATGLDPAQLSALRDHLERANLLVAEWDLTQPFPPDADANDADPNLPRQKVLMVLPPPLGMPNMGYRAPQQPPPFGPEHARKIADVIDAGTAAVFLGRFPPFARSDPLSDDLRDRWGIDLKADHLVIPAVRSREEPGRFRLEAVRFHYFPLNTFTDHVIVRPLQGQRTLWRSLCPVDTAGAEAAGVKVYPLLRVPAAWDHTWATPNPRRVVQAFQDGESVVPDPATDLGLGEPIDVAVAAVRKGDDANGVRPARIAVLGTLGGLLDEYLDAPVLAGPRADRTEPAPRANADLVINSIYWLVGREDYIAAGPARVQPIRNIDRGALRWLWVLCVAGLPLAVLGAGGAVLLVRRR